MLSPPRKKIRNNTINVENDVLMVRSRVSLDTVVEQRLVILLLMQTEVLPNTVEDHHPIINRVTNHGKDGTDERLIDLQREWHPAPTE